MSNNQPHILENRDTEQLKIFIVIEFIDTEIFYIKLRLTFSTVFQMMECLQQQSFHLHYGM